MCENCSRVFATHDEWEAHLGDCSGEAAATAKDDRLECPICNQVLATEKSYEDHIKGHYEGSTVSEQAIQNIHHPSILCRNCQIT